MAVWDLQLLRLNPQWGQSAPAMARSGHAHSKHELKLKQNIRLLEEISKKLIGVVDVCSERSIGSWEVSHKRKEWFHFISSRVGSDLTRNRWECVCVVGRREMYSLKSLSTSENQLSHRAGKLSKGSPSPYVWLFPPHSQRKKEMFVNYCVGCPSHFFF